MTVFELIAARQTHDPAATVVVTTYNDRTDVCNALELQLDGVRAVSPRPVTPTSSWFEPTTAQRYSKLTTTARFQE